MSSQPLHPRTPRPHLTSPGGGGTRGISRLFLPAIIVLFLANTLWRIFALPIWGDEVRTWRDSVNKPYAQILTWQHNKDHAPLGHLLAKASSDLFRTDAPWAMRLPSFLFGLACVPLGYALGRAANDRRTGWLIAVLIAVDPTVAGQTQQARMYTMFLAFSLAAMICIIHAMRRASDSADWRGRSLQALAIGGTLAGALWSHYAAITLIVAVLLTALAMLAVRRSRFAGATMLAGIAVALLLSIQGIQKLVSMAGREKLPYNKTRDTWHQILFAGESAAGHRVLFVIFIAAAVVGLIVLARRRLWPAVLLLLTVAIGFANLLIASRYRQIEGARYFVGLLPAVWVGLCVLAVWVGRNPNRWISRAAALLFIAGAINQAAQAYRAPLHPQARPLAHAAAVLPSLGYVQGQPVFFAPQDPVATYATYYHLTASEWLQERLIDAFTRTGLSRKTLAPKKPPVLWVLVVTPCRPQQRNTEADGLGLAQTAARAYGQTLAPDRLPQEWKQRRLSIVRITATDLKVWTAEGERR